MCATSATGRPELLRQRGLEAQAAPGLVREAKLKLRQRPAACPGARAGRSRHLVDARRERAELRDRGREHGIVRIDALRDEDEPPLDDVRVAEGERQARASELDSRASGLPMKRIVWCVGTKPAASTAPPRSRDGARTGAAPAARPSRLARAGADGPTRSATTELFRPLAASRARRRPSPVGSEHLVARGEATIPPVQVLLAADDVIRPVAPQHRLSRRGARHRATSSPAHERPRPEPQPPDRASRACRGGSAPSGIREGEHAGDAASPAASRSCFAPARRRCRVRARSGSVAACTRRRRPPPRRRAASR